MGNKRRFVHKKNDGPIQGKEVLHIDQRTCYCPEEEWEKHIEMWNTGLQKSEAYIKYEHVEQIMVENEMLRESLYANQNEDYNRAIDIILTRAGHSTSNIIKMADSIEDYSKGTIKAQEAFRIVYATMKYIHRIDLRNRKPKESKLQYCWRTGQLPLVSQLMCALKDTLLTLHRLDGPGATKYFGTLARKLRPLPKKKP